jgi:hypothetical protein
MNYEGQRRSESPTFPATLVDNLAAINAAKAFMGLAPENLDLLKTADVDNGFIKLDHQLSLAHRMSIRYNIEDARDLNVLVGNTLDGGGIGAPSSGHNLFLRDQSLVGTISSQVTPNFINSALVQYARRHYDFPGVTGQPNLDIPNTLLFGHNFGVFDFIGETRLQFSDSGAWVRGTHVVNFGVDTNFIRNKVTWPGFTPMRIVVPGLNCMVDFANFVNKDGKAPLPQFGAEPPCPLSPFFNGVPIIFWGAPLGNGPVVEGSLPPPIPTTWENAFLPDQTEAFNVRLNHSYFGAFIQDQWKVNSKLTFNYGLRWDFEGGLTKQVEHDLNNFAPRVGIAYSPDSHTVIRAGGGIFFDRYNLGFFFVTFPQRPPSLVIDLVNGMPVVLPGPRQGAETAGYSLNQEPTIPGLVDSATDARVLLLTGQVPPNFLFPPNGAGGRFLNTVAVDGVDPHSKTSYSEQASFEIDREIGKGLTISAGYLFVSAHKLVRAENLNVSCSPPAVATRDSNNVVTGCEGLPKLPNGKNLFNGPQYNAGLVYYTDNSGNSIYHGLTVQANERAGRYFRLGANYTFSKTLDDGTYTTFVSTPQDLYQRSLERANSNQDIRHRFIANFVATGPEQSFARDFELSSIVTAQSGRPFTIFTGFDANNDTNPVTDRVGASTRNSFLGDKLVSVDLRLSRFFRIKERVRLQLIAEAFNLFNRPNVDEVFSVYFAPDFIAGVPRHYKDGVIDPANPAFGSPRTMFNPRQFQLAAKLTF